MIGNRHAKNGRNGRATSAEGKRGQMRASAAAPVSAPAREGAAQPTCQTRLVPHDCPRVANG